VDGRQLWNQLPVTVQATSANIGLFQTSTEDAPVSVIGCLTADDSTSEALLWRWPISKTITLTVLVFLFQHFSYFIGQAVII